MTASSSPIADGPLVAIIGRPNVGKSTLFNRLSGTKHALVHDAPGVTRDRREGRGRLADLEFRLVDTAGLEEAPAESLAGRMRRQTEYAIAEADLVLFVIDAETGVTPADRDFARMLRRSERPVLVLANKSESRAGKGGAFEGFELGLGEPIAISAAHGEGMDGLYDALRDALPEAFGQPLDEDEEAVEAGADGEDEVSIDRPISLVIIGRPNVGKSTLVNRLLGQDRVLTGPEAGLTRDAIAVPFEAEGRRFTLIDTAGLRRRARVEGDLEKMSNADTLRALRFAQCAVLVLDGTLGIDKQDLTIADRVIEEGRALVVAINKWDAVQDRPALLAEVRDRLQFSLPQVRGVPVETISAEGGRNLDRLMRAVLGQVERWSTRVPTAELNRWLERAIEAHPPPLVEGRRIKIRYATQIKARPPTVALFATKAQALPESYQRYLMHSLRETFGLDGVPVRISLRRPRNPFATEA